MGTKRAADDADAARGRRFAADDVEWDATRACDECVPQRWGKWADGRLKLKDTQGGKYVNTLDAPNQFTYKLPPGDYIKPWEQALVDRLERERDTAVVELFSSPGSRNEYYGEWAVHDMQETMVRLRRLRSQTPGLAAKYAGKAGPAYRSKNEKWHGEVLCALFPEEDGYVVRHEPETVMDVHVPTVVGGRPNGPRLVSATYTCDYVVCHREGTFRLCVESKPSVESLTDEAKAKCRFLKTNVHQRVVAMVGTTFTGCSYYDFGRIGDGEEGEVWRDEVAFATMFGVARSPPSV